MAHRTLSQGIILLIAAIVLLAPTLAPAQEIGPKLEEQSLGQLLFNIRYHIRMMEFDLATRYINFVIEKKPEAMELVGTIENDPNNILNRRDDGLYAWLTKAALRSDKPELAKAASALDKYIQESIVKLKKDPTTITREIERLAGGPRDYDLAVERLKWMAPWSVPMMVNVLMDEGRAKLHKYVTTALPLMGRPAVEPLCEALDMTNNAPVKLVVVRTLAKIGYPHAIPYLQEQFENDKAEQVRAECQEAIRQLLRAPRAVYSGKASTMFYQLADGYYTDQPSLRAITPGETAPVWNWSLSLNAVVSIEVPIDVYNEVMSVRALARSLTLDKSQPDAVALWLSSVIRMQAQLNGAPNPLGLVDANYYAVLAGPSVLLRALGRSITDGDSAVAFGVVKALNDVGVPRGASDVAGALQLSLMFPDRRVRYETTGAYKPTGSARLPGTDIAVKVMCEAISQTGQKYALALLPKPDDSKAILEQLAAAGYPADRIKVVGTRQAAFDAVRAENSALLDLVVLAYDSPEVGLAGLIALRDDYRFRHVPTLLLTGATESANETVRSIPMVSVVKPDVPAAEISEKVSAQLTRAGMVPLTEDEAKSYAVRSADMLRLLALEPMTVRDVEAAADTLIKALADPRQEVAIAAGNAAAALPLPKPQQALAQAGMDANADPAKRVAMFAALADSFKRQGNKLTSDQFDSMLKVATTDANNEIRVAAAKAAGAAGATMQIEVLILGK